MAECADSLAQHESLERDLQHVIPARVRADPFSLSAGSDSSEFLRGWQGNVRRYYTTPR